jgi:CBS domain-containing protein
MSEMTQATAEELMTTPVIAVTVDHSVAAAWEAMRERRVHHLAVMGEHGLVALLDDRTLAAHWPAGGPEAPHSTRVGDLAARGVRCVRPDQTAAAVAGVMADGHCDAVPVVTVAGVLLGLVTATDLVAAVARGALPVAAHAGSWKHGGRG